MTTATRKNLGDVLAALSIATIIIGGIAWLTSMANGFSELSKKFDSLSTRQDQYIQTVQSIDNRLNRIEGKLDNSQ